MRSIVVIALIVGALVTAGWFFTKNNTTPPFPNDPMEVPGTVTTPVETD
jgi:hypothetical protein